MFVVMAFVVIAVYLSVGCIVASGWAADLDHRGRYVEDTTLGMAVIVWPLIVVARAVAEIGQFVRRRCPTCS